LCQPLSCNYWGSAPPLSAGPRSLSAQPRFARALPSVLLSYSCSFQQERKKGHRPHKARPPVRTRYSLPCTLSTPRAVISSRQGGVRDLHPCLLSQFMQYPDFGLTATPPCWI